jgi:hypothetical protein
MTSRRVPLDWETVDQILPASSPLSGPTAIIPFRVLLFSWMRKSMARLKAKPSPTVTAVRVRWIIRSKFMVVRRTLLSSQRIESRGSLLVLTGQLEVSE